jgi:hypothetical protein
MRGISWQKIIAGCRQQACPHAVSVCTLASTGIEPSVESNSRRDQPISQVKEGSCHAYPIHRSPRCRARHLPRAGRLRGATRPALGAVSQ